MSSSTRGEYSMVYGHSGALHVPRALSVLLSIMRFHFRSLIVGYSRAQNTCNSGSSSQLPSDSGGANPPKSGCYTDNRGASFQPGRIGAPARPLETAG